MNEMTLARVAFGLLTAMFIVLTPQVLSDQFNLINKVKEAQNWPTVTGTVKNLERKEERNRRTSNGFHVNVDYDYKVDGASYSNQQNTFLTSGQLLTNTMSNAEDSAEIASRFPVGKSVLVRYNKNAPAQSYIDVGISTAAYLPLVALPVVDGVLLLITVALCNNGAARIFGRRSFA